MNYINELILPNAKYLTENEIEDDIKNYETDDVHFDVILTDNVRNQIQSKIVQNEDYYEYGNIHSNRMQLLSYWMCLLRMEINNFKFLKCNDMKKYGNKYRYNMDNNLGVMECTLSFDPETKPILNVTSFIFNKFSHHYFGYGAEYDIVLESNRNLKIIISEQRLNEIITEEINKILE